MSNRQARREQSRTSRTSRPAARPTGGSRRPGGGSSSGGGSNIFSRGFLLFLAAIIIIAIPITIAIVTLSGGGSDDELVTSLEESAANLPLEMANGTKLGRDDAPVKLQMFEDFQCPFCLRYTGEQEGPIIEELVKTGEMQIEYRHLTILGPESVRAATASECAAEQNKFWPYQQRLFLTQARAGQAENEEKNVGRFTDERLKQFAGDLGLDQAKFDQCLESNKFLEKVTNDQRDATQFGIAGTPGFVINGQALGQGTPVGIENWKMLVEDVKNAIATATANALASPSTTTTSTTTASPAASPATTTTPAASPTPTATRTP